MRRRELIAAALASACAPLNLTAQPAAKLHRIGWLDYSSAAENLGVFVQAMTALGWQKGKTFRIEYRGGEGRGEHLSAVAAELVRLPADLIVAPGTPEALAARKATNVIPIVMAGVDDPVDRGLVASLARPGGNVTGLANARREFSGKLLSLLREIFPRATSVAVLWDSTDPEPRVILGYIQAAAKTLGVTVNAVQVQRYAEVEPAFAAIKKQGNPMMIVPPSSLLNSKWVADLALSQGLALASIAPGYAYDGGLIAFTDDWRAVFDRVAAFVDKILKGGKPADLPVELPTRFKLIINGKTARTLGVAIPQSIMLRADHVVE
jgi:putative tryptophan/tyrosine transport system substrate-binding protein